MGFFVDYHFYNFISSCFFHFHYDKSRAYYLFSLLCGYQLDFAFNALLSMNMVVTLLVALVLDNTVPGSRQERGVYIWSRAEEMETDPSFLADYSLPKKIAPAFCRTKCLGS